MTPCDKCAHRVTKSSASTGDSSMLECKPPVTPSILYAAYLKFAADGAVVTPFVVAALPDVTRDAWPFFFLAAHLDRCEGFTPLPA